MSRDHDRCCMGVDFGKCGSREEAPRSSRSHRRHERKDSDGGDRLHRNEYSRHHSDRAESPVIAIRQATVPKDAERHRSRHRTSSREAPTSRHSSKQRSSSRETSTSRLPRASSVRRHETVFGHPEEATSSRPKRSSSVHPREVTPHFERWAPARKGEGIYAEPVRVPREWDHSPSRRSHHAPPSVVIPPPPPPHRRNTSDVYSSNNSESSRPHGRPYDGHAIDLDNRDARRRQEPLSFASRFEEAMREGSHHGHRRKHSYDYPSAGVPLDQRTVHVEHFYTSSEGPGDENHHHRPSKFPERGGFGTTYHQSFQESSQPFHDIPFFEMRGVPVFGSGPPPPHHAFTDNPSFYGENFHQRPPPSSHGDHHPRPGSNRGHEYRSEPNRGHEYRPRPNRGHEYRPEPSGGAYAFEEPTPAKNLAPYWSELGLQPGADDSAIRSAYKKLALKYHPDRAINMSEKEKDRMQKRFVSVKEAHDILLEK